MGNMEEFITEWRGLNEKIDAHFVARVREFCAKTGFGFSNGMGGFFIEFLPDSIKNNYFYDDDIRDALEYHKGRLEEIKASTVKDFVWGSGGDKHEVTEDDIRFYNDTKKRIEYAIEVCETFSGILKDADELESELGIKYILASIKINDIKPLK